MNMVITLTVCEMSGLVQIMTYKRLPTTYEYNTRDILILFASFSGLVLEIDKKWGRNLLQSCLSKCHRL